MKQREITVNINVTHTILVQMRYIGIIPMKTIVAGNSVLINKSSFRKILTNENVPH